MYNIFEIIKNCTKNENQSYGDILAGKAKVPEMSVDEESIYNEIKQSDINRLRRFG